MVPRWFYDFARRRRSRAGGLVVSLRQQESFAWEALAFAKGKSWSASSATRPPSWAEVTSAHFHLGASILVPLKGGSCSASWKGNLFLHDDGTIGALTVTDGLDFRAAFLCQAVEFLRQQSARGIRLRFCSHCGMPFPAKRLDAKHCANTSCRTLAWRKDNRQKFQKQRKLAYRRMVLGEPAPKPSRAKKGA